MDYSILLIEDEQDARELLARGLERQGFRVQAAGDGEAGMALLERANFDVLITDLHMPIVDGNTLLENIRDLHKRMIRIVITGFNDSENIKRALNANTDHLIEKPVDLMGLDLLIKKLLQERDSLVDDYDEEELDDLTQRLYDIRLKTLQLTTRQRLLVSYILKGMSNKSIADVTGQSEQVIKNAISNLYKKLGIGSRSQLFHVVFPV